MAYTLSDIFIGNYDITQHFGDRHDLYHARFNLQGHNGVDFACPTGTMILAAANGTVSQVGFDEGGYGKYIVINHEGYATLYGHLNDQAVTVGQKVVAGQLIGHSNNTGLSDGPHLHFGIKPLDANNNKAFPDNGYSGYINPMDESLCHWDIKNLQEPINPAHEVDPQVSISSHELGILRMQQTQLLSIVEFGQRNGLGDFLTQHGYDIDMKNAPDDSTLAQKVNSWVADLVNRLQHPNTTGQQTQEVAVENIASQLQSSLGSLPSQKKDSILQGILKSLFSGWVANGK